MERLLYYIHSQDLQRYLHLHLATLKADGKHQTPYTYSQSTQDLTLHQWVEAWSIVSEHSRILESMIFM